jgi:ABC-2 type transport system ATP-binding protein
MNNIINIQNLKKSYGAISAIDNISLEIKKGEMFGIVGPDGAGKTSTIRVLCGLLPFDNGKIEIMGKELVKYRKEIQREIGYLSQKFSLYEDLTIDENLEFSADIHDVKNFKSRRNELLQFTHLIEFRNRLAENLSGGMKQKLALACSLIHKPEILFLDEPTTGVDPVSRRDFWKILSQLQREKITIVMTTPYLDEAERCNRVALMNKGKVIAVDEPGKIKKSIRKKVIEIICSPIREAYALFKDEFAENVQMFGDRLNFVVDDVEQNKINIIDKMNNNSIEIGEVRVIPPSLENVFIHLVKKAS